MRIDFVRTETDGTGDTTLIGSYEWPPRDDRFQVMTVDAKVVIGNSLKDLADKLEAMYCEQPGDPVKMREES